MVSGRETAPTIRGNRIHDNLSHGICVSVGAAMSHEAIAFDSHPNVSPDSERALSSLDKRPAPSSWGSYRRRSTE